MWGEVRISSGGGGEVVMKRMLLAIVLAFTAINHADARGDVVHLHCEDVNPHLTNHKLPLRQNIWMSSPGHICPFGGTHLSRGWDTCRTPVPISLLFSLYVLLHRIGGGHG